MVLPCHYNQKVSLARAFLRRGKVKLLDEPTSGLDAYAEIDVLKNFIERENKWSEVIISHRIAYAAMCDRILMMENGRIICSPASATYRRSLPVRAWMILSATASR